MSVHEVGAGVCGGGDTGSGEAGVCPWVLVVLRVRAPWVSSCALLPPRGRLKGSRTATGQSVLLCPSLWGNSPVLLPDFQARLPATPGFRVRISSSSVGYERTKPDQRLPLTVHLWVQLRESSGPWPCPCSPVTSQQPRHSPPCRALRTAWGDSSYHWTPPHLPQCTPMGGSQQCPPLPAPQRGGAFLTSFLPSLSPLELSLCTVHGLLYELGVA